MADTHEIDALRRGMAAIEQAIGAGVHAAGCALAASDFRWNSGRPILDCADRVTLRIALGPYRSFEETFSREQLTLALRDPTVQVFVAAAINRLTQGAPPAG